LTGRKARLPETDEGGPLGWLLEMIETGHTPLEESGSAAVAEANIPTSSLGFAAPKVVAPSSSFWRDVLLEYKRRKAASARRGVAAPMPTGSLAVPTFIPAERSWVPLGPTVVINGQTVGNQPIGGRVARLAVARGGSVLYAASANGGVFRSADGGTTWRAMMDRFDTDPTTFASASVICGAIAIDPNDPNRLYVGTGEGDTSQLFRARIVNALPAYRGVGPLRSDDGGVTWVSETSTPDLAGEAFFALAVDPRARDTVIAATSNGLYGRVASAGGGFEWRQQRAGVFSSVIVAATATATRFICAQWTQDPTATPAGVFHSDDGGQTWTATGTGFPADAGRIALGVRADDPNTVYALVAAHGTGTLQGLYRLDAVAGNWKTVGALPDVLPVQNGRSQGDYDLAIAVDPADPNRVYLGGSYADLDPFPASIWRCEITPSGANYTVASSASIGTHAHADVHSLVHTPGDPDELWCTCDGGVFLNRAPRSNGEFASQNNGLACLCSNFLGQHPTDPNILFTGLQDNGTARTAAGPVWTHIMGGDGGYCLVNWADPSQVLVFANGTVYRSTTGGTSEDGWTMWNFPWATMTQPIVGPPYNPGRPSDAQIVAVAAGQRIFVSDDFAQSWGQKFDIPNGAAIGAVFAMSFASPTRLFMGTTTGKVFRADRAGTTWRVTQLDNVAAGALNVNGLITDVAVDWADANRQSVYVAFGGMGTAARVWWFDGARWQSRNGAPGNNLLNVEHNALAVDPVAPDNVYVGADIGVWHSDDRGQNWHVFENGLPGAPVFDLQIHPTQRLLRAATYGRGVYEIPLS
jgi:hypothetical protein